MDNNNNSRNIPVPLEGTATTAQPNRRPLAEFVDLIEICLQLKGLGEALLYDTLGDGDTPDPNFDYDEDLTEEEKEIDKEAAFTIYMALSLETADQVKEYKEHAAPLLRRLKKVMTEQYALSICVYCVMLCCMHGIWGMFSFVC